MNISEANRVRLLYFFTFCCQAAWVPRYAEYLEGKGFSGFQLGFILSLTPILMFLIQPIVGYIADKFGHKKTLLFGALLAGVFFLGHLLQGGFYYIAFVTVMMSLFFNTTQPIIDSLALQAVENDSNVSYGSLRIAGAIAWSVMGVVNGYLIDQFTLKVIFVIASVAMAITFLFALTVPVKIKKKDVESAKFDFNMLFHNKQLLFFLFITLFISLASHTIWNFYSLFMKEIGASSKLTGFGYTLQGLCELPLFYFSAVIIRKFGLKKVLLFTLLVTSIRMVLYSTVKDPQMALFIEVSHGISWSLFWVVCVELVNKLVPEQWRATGQSMLYASYFGIGAIAGNFWTSFLIDNMTLGSVFLLNAGIIVATGLCIWIFIRNSVDKERAV